MLILTSEVSTIFEHSGSFLISSSRRIIIGFILLFTYGDIVVVFIPSHYKLLPPRQVSSLLICVPSVAHTATLIKTNISLCSHMYVRRNKCSYTALKHSEEHYNMVTGLYINGRYVCFTNTTIALLLHRLLNLFIKYFSFVRPSVTSLKC